jgi:hypothetical protein
LFPVEVAAVVVVVVALHVLITSTDSIPFTARKLVDAIEYY